MVKAMSKSNADLLKEAIDVYLSSLKYLDNFVSEPATKYGLSFEQYLILHTIAEQDNVSLMDIASERRVTRSAISRQIKVLLQHDYIYQKPAESDRRRLYLHLTPTGKETEKKVNDLITARFDRWISRYGDEKVKAILQFIRVFAAEEMQNTTYASK
ncbi:MULTISPECIES: MarR family winged helix-turn-helix transcriptional regulator [Lentilactobacillus]|jgi:DNA-binding MarR family transcriptional regulator|uniref:Regulatory protein MarR n=3 Tax=Lentilactobacillus parabuchneri TaxID=152331 RepID=A0A0R1Z896_9LACO|nr:MarR family transcriptional regulator [Lentilactobacillus parabuchneri]KRM48025.1 regulatory protein MarR [Lentilactobacillus parabuchneri DSM 5707 = NBRC 107865]MBW0222489.1 MarR family transcriptional regulator [Lentilactobacillus parabuchneri]MBW0244674.1 MarR family transcriptional regulator [Lentilactobacillus parabuchneri]MBW0262752.1 MarR family transcriptional regulator [Lentilactobacillus parabuchneri]MDB1103601.1 MarR family transcriptional regulator [Lentilactobacillus parabuchne